MQRKTIRIALLVLLLALTTVTSAFASSQTYPIRVEVEKGRYEQINFQEFPVHKVIAPRGLEYLELQSRTGERSIVRFDQFPAVYTVEIPEVRASIDLVCGGMTYTVKTGNSHGTCVNSGGEVTCADNGGNSGGATCENGCEGSSGSGSCSAKPNGS